MRSSVWSGSRLPWNRLHNCQSWRAWPFRTRLVAALLVAIGSNTEQLWKSLQSVWKNEMWRSGGWNVDPWTSGTGKHGEVISTPCVFSSDFPVVPMTFRLTLGIPGIPGDGSPGEAVQDAGGSQSLHGLQEKRGPRCWPGMEILVVLHGLLQQVLRQSSKKQVTALLPSGAKRIFLVLSFFFKREPGSKALWPTLCNDWLAIDDFTNPICDWFPSGDMCRQPSGGLLTRWFPQIPHSSAPVTAGAATGSRWSLLTKPHASCNTAQLSHAKIWRVVL